MATNYFQEALAELNKSINNCPLEDELTEDPKALAKKLLPHQQSGLTWMLWRESQQPSGGLLADDMGLGKTMSAISLIFKDMEMIHENASPENHSSNGGTLVICPASLVIQWRDEVTKMFKKIGNQSLSLYVHHGLNRHKGSSDLAVFSIIITSYSIVVQEFKKVNSPLFKLKWNRIICDEAHIFRNEESQTSKAVTELNAEHRWCLTGTPINNRSNDLFALLQFLRCPLIDKLQWLNESAEGEQQLIALLKPLMLRRTKEELKSKGRLEGLPYRSMKKIDVYLNEKERMLYKTLISLYESDFQQYLENRQLPRPNILRHLLHLRLICCHPHLVKEVLLDEELELDGEDYGDLENIRTSQSDLTFSKETPSSKIEKVWDLLQNTILISDDKAIIVSQWTSMLNIVATFLTLKKVQYELLTGKDPVAKRPEIVRDFNQPDGGPKILLLSLTAGGVGLNLIGANHLFLIDNHWNPQLEAQCFDRIYRIGQMKNVYIYKFETINTIEKHIGLIQDKKLQVADNILTGTTDTPADSLTLLVLRKLFSS